ncbi:MAG: ATP-binding protein [Candidatus Aenigmatarchaeota archaeon]|nr:ATP-binding protein [Candidatus Aenigmarchaeota archaeon]
MSRFHNREFEIKFLEDRYKRDNFELIIVYGRRRIGKTELIKNFTKNKKHIYFLCDKKGTESNIKRFKTKISELLGEPVIESNDLEEIFSYLVKKVGEKLVIVFDEFSYLVEKDDAIPSVFSRAIDEVLKYTNHFMILCGSSISMMEEGALSYKSPLYGRKTGHIKLDELPFSSFSSFFPKNSKEKNIEFYSITGGIPFYMEKFNENISTLENVENEIASRKGRLFEEVDFILKEELREPDVYKTVIEGIAKGNTKIVDISNYTRIESNKLTRYINTLLRLGIIKKENIITEKNPKSKKTIYFVDDNFFNFYFRFIEPFKSDLTIGEMNAFKKNFSKNFNTFVGKAFEKLVRKELIRSLNLPFSPSKIGRWWGYFRKGEKRETIEIDIAAIEENSKQAAFFECKWKDLKEKEALKILDKLKEKSKFVQWHNEKRREYFGLIAKKIENKERLRKQGYLVFDLRDF